MQSKPGEKKKKNRLRRSYINLFFKRISLVIRVLWENDYNYYRWHNIWIYMRVWMKRKKKGFHDDYLVLPVNDDFNIKEIVTLMKSGWNGVNWWNHFKSNGPKKIMDALGNIMRLLLLLTG